MPPLRFKTGSVEIEMDDVLDRAVRETLDKLAPGVLQRIEADVERVANEARAEWPKGKRRRSAAQPTHSRDEIEHGVVIDGDVIRGYVRNGAWWAIYVRPAKLYSGTTAIVEYLRKPMQRVYRQLIEDIGDIILRPWER